MELGQRIVLEQKQELVMTQELRQAIELLQYNSLELNQFIQEQIEENPMLELKKSKEEANDEIDWEEYIKSNKNTYYTPSQGENSENDINYDAFIGSKVSLEEYLLKQLGLLKISEKEYGIGKYIIQNINGDGYLTMSVDEISKKLKEDKSLIEKSLKYVQSLNPAGIGGRTLEESLDLQLKELGINKQVENKIVKDYLVDLGHNRIRKISKELNISLKEVEEAFDLIKTLDPKPGRSISGESLNVKYIYPDATLKKIDGEYIVLINDITGPRLNINSHYKKILLDKKNEEASEFLSSRFDSAVWIIKSIEQRRQTIRKVVESILKHQKDFFEDGESPLRPLTLKEVAEDIDMHESTISRATSGKYLQTPYGTYEMKYFFNEGLEGSEGKVATVDVKDRIEEIIDREDKKKPYSDQKIADKLDEEGIKISRRTVAKYRNELGILSSTRRRRY